MEVVGVRQSDLSAVLLSLKLQFKVEADDLRVIEALGLLFEACVGERLLEGNALYEEGVRDGATSDLLNTNVILVQITRDGHDSIDDQLSKELLLLGDNL